jgi:hypothetical protein
MYRNKADTVRIAAQATGFSASVIDKTYEVVLMQKRLSQSTMVSKTNDSPTPLPKCSRSGS